MKIKVNGTTYEIEIMQQKVKVNNIQELDMVASIDEEKIMIDGKTYHLDFVEEGEPITYDNKRNDIFGFKSVTNSQFSP